MIACPNCGNEMRVTETRTVDQYVRRRRHCPIQSCGARVTTAEIVVALDDGRSKPIGDAIVMPRRDVEDVLKTLCSALAGRYGTQAVLDMVGAVLPSHATTEKGTTDGDNHGNGIEQWAARRENER